MPFEPAVLDAGMLDVLRAVDALEPLDDGRFACRQRVSTLGTDLFLHSVFPIDDKDAVFLGPVGHDPSCPTQRAGAQRDRSGAVPRYDLDR